MQACFAYNFDSAFKFHHRLPNLNNFLQLFHILVNSPFKHNALFFLKEFLTKKASRASPKKFSSKRASPCGKPLPSPFFFFFLSAYVVTYRNQR